MTAQRWTIFRKVWRFNGGDSPEGWNVLHPEAELPSTPADNERLESVDVIEVAVLEGLAEAFEEQAEADRRDEQEYAERALKEPHRRNGLLASAEMHGGHSNAFREAAKEIRNLIEGGRAG